MSVPHAPLPRAPLFNPEDPDAEVPVRGEDDESTWFTRHVRGIVIALYAAAALLVLLDLLYTKHGHFGEEGWFGFYGLYGFVGCVTLVMLAKVLRKVVMRREDYWDA